jgi:hypothetical protein
MRRRLIGGLFLLLLGVLASLLSAACDGGKDDAVPLPDLAPFDQELATRLERIADTASELRGLDENRDIAQGTITCAAMAAYARDTAGEARAEHEAEIDAINALYRLLHMMGRDEDLLEASVAISAQVLGFYSQEDEALVLISDTPQELTLGDEITLAHEYTHSFQDRAFDLDRLQALGEDEEGRATEYHDTVPALVEGDARLVEWLYWEARLNDSDRREDPADLLDSPTVPCQTEDLDDRPPAAVQRLFYFPYDYGSLFVESLHRDGGGWRAVDDAYRDPPTTEEQILHPEKYLAHEKPDELALPDISEELGEGWEQETDAMFGEYDVVNWLLSVSENESLADDGLAGADQFDPFLAAEGWGGGRFAVYADSATAGRVVLHLVLTWDDAGEAEDFSRAFDHIVTLIDA